MTAYAPKIRLNQVMRVSGDFPVVPCFFTWNREEGEDAQRHDAEFCEGEVYTDDVYQNLLGDVGGPEHHKAELGAETCSQVVRKGHERETRECQALCCPGVRREREGDPARAGAGGPVLELHHPALFSPADTGPGPRPHVPHGDPGGHGAGVGASERVTRPVEGPVCSHGKLDP